jgi:hypothetical protein
VIPNFDSWQVLEATSPFTAGQIVEVHADDVIRGAVQGQVKYKWTTVALNNDDPDSSLLRSNRHYGARVSLKWGADFIDYMKKEKKPLFLFEVTSVAVKFIEGRVLFSNIGDMTGRRIRLVKPSMNWKPADPTLVKILKKSEKSFVKHDDTTLRFFPAAKDIYDRNGNEAKDFTPGQYKIKGIDFEASLKNKEMMVVIVDETESQVDFEKYFTMKISDFVKTGEKFPIEKLKVIAEYCGKVLGARVEYDKDYEKFRIPWFEITEEDENNEHAFRARPFFSREQAERHLEYLATSKERFPFKVENLTVIECGKYDQYELSFSQLIDYVKAFEVDFDLLKFLEEKRGAVAAKKFGF